LGITSERSASRPTHRPPGYDCPFCTLTAGGETDFNHQDDVVWRDRETIAFMSPKWWETSPAHVIVVPTEHFENLYELPDATLAAVYATAKRIALALREVYGCDGTSTRQHNEPGAGQDVWHFHVHVFPRYVGDGLYENDKRVRWVDAAERAPFAERLREHLHPGA
jgi:histidine triad (HIT) family protein